MSTTHGKTTARSGVLSCTLKRRSWARVRCAGAPKQRRHEANLRRRACLVWTVGGKLVWVCVYECGERTFDAPLVTVEAGTTGLLGTPVVGELHAAMSTSATQARPLWDIRRDGGLDLTLFVTSGIERGAVAGERLIEIERLVRADVGALPADSKERADGVPEAFNQRAAVEVVIGGRCRLVWERKVILRFLERGRRARVAEGVTEAGQPAVSQQIVALWDGRGQQCAILR
jgi:hypothetical protein